MKDFLIKTENYSKEDKLYLVGLIFMLGYKCKYANVPVCYEAIEDCKYMFFDTIDSETYCISTSRNRETRLCHPKDPRIIISLTWEEYPKDEYASLEKWTPKYEEWTLTNLEEKCDFLSMYSKEQIIYIGSCVPAMTIKSNINYTYKKPYNPYKLVDRNYDFHYHTGEGEDAL